MYFINLLLIILRSCVDKYIFYIIVHILRYFKVYII